MSLRYIVKSTRIFLTQRLNRFRGYGYGAGQARILIDRSLFPLHLERRIAMGSFGVPEFKAARAIIRPGDTVVELGVINAYPSRKFVVLRRLQKMEVIPVSESKCSL